MRDVYKEARMINSTPHQRIPPLIIFLKNFLKRKQETLETEEKDKGRICSKNKLSHGL